MLRFDPTHTGGYYDAYGDRESARWLTDARAQFEYALVCHHLHKRVTEGQRVLDAGCGPGTFTKVLLELGALIRRLARPWRPSFVLL